MPVREPFGPVQIAPTGFLGFFQLKSRGHTPSNVPDTLQATVDMREWFFNTQSTVLIGAFGATVTTASSNTFIPWGPDRMLVPDDEWWYVVNYSVRAVASVGSPVGTTPAFADPRQGAAAQVFFVAPTIQGGGVSPVVAGGGFWLRPGAELGLWITFMGGSDQFYGSVSIVRLPI